MKLQEVRYILQEAGTEIDSKDLDSTCQDLSRCSGCSRSLSHEVPELQGTTEEIATEKCRRAAELLGGPCITEDTALCFEALNGLPGPYIKHFLNGLGLEGKWPAAYRT